jgi:hypothetical protein
LLLCEKRRVEKHGYAALPEKKGKCPLGQNGESAVEETKKGTRIPRKTLAKEEITPPIAHATEQKYASRKNR